MYLAPLNYYQFFKKVFSDDRIAKRFLEDFLNVEIEELQKLDSDHRITDNATQVKFDYRCKIEGHYVIVDMQQWYKSDIAKRFFVYHCLNTVLQLEKLKTKVIPVKLSSKMEDIVTVGADDITKKVMAKKTLNYKEIIPVITLIWLVDESFNSKVETICFAPTDSRVVDFVTNDDLWNTLKLDQLTEVRDEVLEALKNSVKEIDFFAKNKLTFMLQKNIVKSQKIKKYVKWFTFAQKTLDKENKESDFVEYKEDEIFIEMMRRLNTKHLSPEEIEYLEETEEVVAEIERYELGILDEGKEIGRKEGKEIGRKEGEEIGIRKGEENIIRKMLENGLSYEDIISNTGLDISTIEAIAEKLNV